MSGIVKFFGKYMYWIGLAVLLGGGFFLYKKGIVKMPSFLKKKTDEADTSLEDDANKISGGSDDAQPFTKIRTVVALEGAA